MLQSKDIDWLKGYKNKIHISCLQGTHFRSKDTHRLKVRGCKKVFHGNEKKAGVAILLSDKIDFKRKTFYNDKWINPARRYNNCKYI